MQFWKQLLPDASLWTGGPKELPDYLGAQACTYPLIWALTYQVLDSVSLTF